MNTVNLLGDSVCIRQIVEGTISEFVDDNITVISSYAFANCSSLKSVSFPACITIRSYAFSYCASLQTVSFPVCTSIGIIAFYSCTSLQTVSFPACTAIEMEAFGNCSSLKSVSFPVCRAIDGYAFENCTSLQTVSFPVCKTIASFAFTNCYSLQTTDFPTCTTINNSAFYKCYHLLSLYLLGSSVPTLANKNAFNSTPISKYTSSTGGVYGSIYVKSSMVDAFKAATNWSAYSARIVATPVYSVRFLNTDDTVLQETEAYYGLDAEYTGSTPISPSAGYIFSGWNPEPKEIKQDTDCVAEYISKYTWEAVKNSIEIGNYADIYSIGDEIPLDLGSEGLVNMQIAAFDRDNLVNGGKAHITFISKELLTTKKRLNPSLKNIWGSCEMRTYLQSTVKALIPSNVQSMIQTVVKEQTGYNGSTSFAETSNDDIWIPSYGEMFGGDTYEPSGIKYRELFPNDASRIKYNNSTGNAANWHLRSTTMGYYTYCVEISGSSVRTSPSNDKGIAIGFCV